MNKKISSLMSFALTAIVLIVSGCGHSEAENAATTIPIFEDKFIVQNSRCSYSIVVPTEAKDKELNAAQTLSYYLKASSKCDIQIVNENNISSDEHYISLGATSQFKSQFADQDFSRLDGKISSYFISTKNDNIYIYSNEKERGEAITYAVFDLLHELINYEFYSSNEIYYTNEETINLRDYRDLFFEPSFDGRSIGTFNLTYNQTNQDNLRLINIYRGTEWCSAIYGHGQVIKFVKPEAPAGNGQTLIEAHPDWFSNKTATVAATNNNQLCWSAGDDLVDYVAKRFTDYFIAFPNATYFMFGQEDNQTSFCKCERCKRLLNGEAINYAGLQIMFMNRVIEKTEAWIKENQPGRQIRYVVFAYYTTKAAPIDKEAAKEGRYIPANDKVKPNEKLYIFYAPITCQFAFPLDNEFFNSETLKEIREWNAIAKGKVIIYFYDTNFRFYLANFGNFDTISEMYRKCKEFGITYMYTQGAMDTFSGALSELRQYVESKIMWNVDIDYEETAKDFINHYYHDASEYMYEYYNTVRTRLTEYHALKQEGGSIYVNIANKTIYPYSVLRYMTTLFDKAMDSIEKYRSSNPLFYDELKARIMKEYLSVIWLKITLSKSELSDDEKREMKEIFYYYTSYFGITKAAEGGAPFNYDEMFGV